MFDIFSIFQNSVSFVADYLVFNGCAEIRKPEAFIRESHIEQYQCFELDVEDTQEGQTFAVKLTHFDPDDCNLMFQIHTRDPENYLKQVSFQMLENRYFQ